MIGKLMNSYQNERNEYYSIGPTPGSPIVIVITATPKMLGFSSWLLPGWQGSPTESGHRAQSTELLFAPNIFIGSDRSWYTWWMHYKHNSPEYLPLLKYLIRKQNALSLKRKPFSNLQPSDCQAWVHYAGMLSVNTGALIHTNKPIRGQHCQPER